MARGRNPRPNWRHARILREYECEKQLWADMWNGGTVELDGERVPIITLSAAEISEIARTQAREQIIKAANKYRVANVGSTLETRA